MRFVYKRFVVRTILILVIFGAYFASFLAVRKPFSITLDFSSKVLPCCYFSESSTMNKIAYCVFYPCIAVSGGINEATLKSRSDAVDAWRKNRVVYFYNWRGRR